MRINLREDHIATFENALPEKMIDAYLNFYKYNEEQGTVYSRTFANHDVADKSISLINKSPDNLVNNFQFEMNVTYNAKPFIRHFF